MELYSSAFQIKSNDVKCRVEWWSGSGDIRSGSQAWLLMRSQQPILLILILVKSCPPLSRTLTCFSTLYTLRENYFREIFDFHQQVVVVLLESQDFIGNFSAWGQNLDKWSDKKMGALEPQTGP